MKTRRKLVLTVVLLLISAYMIQAAAISLRLRSIVQSSFDNFGEANPYADSVSDELYAKMCFRNGYLISAKDSPNVIAPISSTAGRISVFRNANVMPTASASMLVAMESMNSSR